MLDSQVLQVAPLIELESQAACVNRARCSLSRAQTTIEWYAGPGEYCPECGERLARRGSVEQSERQRRRAAQPGRLPVAVERPRISRNRVIVCAAIAVACVVSWSLSVIALCAVGILCLSLTLPSDRAQRTAKYVVYPWLRGPVDRLKLRWIYRIASWERRRVMLIRGAWIVLQTKWLRGFLR